MREALLTWGIGQPFHILQCDVAYTLGQHFIASISWQADGPSCLMYACLIWKENWREQVMPHSSLSRCCTIESVKWEVAVDGPGFNVLRP